MAAAIPSTSTNTHVLKGKLSPWNVEVVTPSSSLIAKFEEIDKTKSHANLKDRKMRSFNRARKWVSNLLKRPFNIPKSDKLRNTDSMMALQHMIDSLAMPGGLSYEDYLWSCLAPLQVQNEGKFTNQTEEETFMVTTEEPTEVGHEGNDPFKCNTCDSVFTLEADLNAHIGSVHEGKKPFKCKNCDASFALEAERNDHIGSVHEGEKLLKCNTCNSEFTLQADLGNHIISVHEGKKLFKCNDCNVQFEEETDLNTHAQSVHEEKRPLICKSIWQGKVCEITDCNRAHPRRCSNPDCLIRDEGLPRWKVLQCRNWHGHPKSKKNTNKNLYRRGQKPPTTHDRAQWPPLPKGKGPLRPDRNHMNATVPIWLNHNPSQNQWLKSGPVQTPSYFGGRNTALQQNFSGNELALWSTPLPRAGNSNWGNLKMDEKLVLAMEVVKLMTSM